MEETGTLCLASDVRTGGKFDEPIIIYGTLIGVYNLTLPEAKSIVIGEKATVKMTDAFISPIGKLFTH